VRIGAAATTSAKAGPILRAALRHPENLRWISAERAGPA
jgi:hypothetical protein